MGNFNGNLALKQNLIIGICSSLLWIVKSFLSKLEFILGLNKELNLNTTSLTITDSFKNLLTQCHSLNSFEI